MKKYIYFIILSAGIVLLSCNNDSTTNSTTTSNNPPAAPNSPNPADSSTNINRFVTFRWECSDPDNDSLKYDVYAGGSYPPSTLIANDTRNKAADYGLAPSNTTIYWKVTAKDNRGAYTNGPIWRCTTGN